MTRNPTESQIRALHAEFTLIKQYREKIIFYDQHFGLLDYPFPGFQHELEILFKLEQNNVLAELFEKERRNAFLPEKRFCFNGEYIVFNIVPVNSYPEVLNDYIISLFVESDPDFRQIAERIKNYAVQDQSALLQYRLTALENIQLIADKIKSNSETSLHNQFMTVFYHGYFDYSNNNFKKFPKRKKILELYLYSQGILYGKYLDALNTYVLQITKDRDKNLVPDATTLDWTGRIVLFQELGILDLLMSKYKKAGRSDTEQKIAKLLCLMLGENLQMSDKIMHYIKTVNSVEQASG